MTPSGQAIILFVEQQTTGGYPKIANVISADLHCVGQLRPRDAIRFTEIPLEEARNLWIEQQQLLGSEERLIRMKRMDLNCDMGELPEMLADGSQEALMKFVTSANVACGGHAGDEAMMRATIEQALRHGVAVGAHPGYEDRENFGRIDLTLDCGTDLQFRVPASENTLPRLRKNAAHGSST